MAVSNCDSGISPAHLIMVDTIYLIPFLGSQKWVGESQGNKRWIYKYCNLTLSPASLGCTLLPCTDIFLRAAEHDSKHLDQICGRWS